MSRTPTPSSVANFAPGSAPLGVFNLQLSTDGGTTWSTVNTGLAGPGSFTSSSCTGAGSSAICIAVGTYGYPFVTGPAIVRSNDGGATWSVPAIPIAGVQNLLSVSCSGSGASAACAAGGMDTSTLSSFVLASTDGGSSWQNKSLNFENICYGGVICYPRSPTVPPDGTPASLYTVVLQPGNGASALTGLSCVGTAPNVSCFAAGGSYAGLDHQLVFVSTDGMLNTWTAAPLAWTDRKVFDTIGCAPANGSITCIATGHFVGSDYSAWAPTVDVSTDSGATWVTKTLPALPAGSNYGQYTKVSYTGSGSSIVWTVSGTANSASNASINIGTTSSDGGASWH